MMGFKEVSFKQLFLISNHLSDGLTTKKLSFNVPSFQRFYSWKESEIEIFFENLLTFDKYKKGKNKKKWFLGFVFLFVLGLKNNNLGKGLQNSKNNFSSLRKRIIDGQQRITTIILFLLAFLQYCKKEFKDSKKTKEIEKELKNIIFLNDSPDTKLTMNFGEKENDQQAYEYIVNEVWKKPQPTEFKTNEKSKTNNLFKSFEYIKKRLDEHLNKIENNKIDFVWRIFSILMENTQFISVTRELNNWEDSPNKVFESLNSTGRELTPLDLIKNYILDTLSHEEEVTQRKLLDKYWNKWEDLFSFLAKTRNLKNKNKEFYNFFYLLTHISSNWNKDFQSLKNIDKRIYMHFKKKFPKFSFYYKDNKTKNKGSATEELNYINKVIWMFFSFFEPLLPALSLKTSKKKHLETLLFWSDNIKEIENKNKHGDFIRINVQKNLLSCFGIEIKILFLFFSLILEAKIINAKEFKKSITIVSASEFLLRIFKDRIGQLSKIYNRFVIQQLDKLLKKNDDVNILSLLDENNVISIKYNVIQELKDFWQKELKKQPAIFNFFNEISKCKEDLKVKLNPKLEEYPSIKKIIFEKLDLEQPIQKEIMFKSFLKFVTNDNYEQIQYSTIEHINSKLSDRERIGNKFFLESELNQRAEDKNILSKLEFYEKSKSKDCQKIVEYIKENENIKKWDEDQVKVREKYLIIKFINKIKSIFEDFSFN